MLDQLLALQLRVASTLYCSDSISVRAVARVLRVPWRWEERSTSRNVGAPHDHVVNDQVIASQQLSGA